MFVNGVEHWTWDESVILVLVGEDGEAGCDLCQTILFDDSNDDLGHWPVCIVPTTVRIRHIGPRLVGGKKFKIF
jgi:hypothetical protein